MKSENAAPAPLHAAARGLLAEFRAMEDMPADARARVRRRLLEADEDVPPRSAVAHAGVRSWIAWSLVGAAAGVALLLGLKAVAPMLSEQREVKPVEAAPDRVERERSTNRATVHDEPPSRAKAPMRAPEVVPAPGAIATPPVPETSTPPPISAVRRPATPPRERTVETPATTEPEPAASASTLDAERRLIAQAWSALARGDAAGALASAASHRDRFAKGVLTPERLAVEAIAHCKRDGDTSRARAFLQAHARSPMASRVRSACALDEARAGSNGSVGR